ncbi:MAG: LLM class flavin-dependent oxidoreductase [Gammaproteobacteria bacterium]|nr:LLM class flavin-dependent oxidoreductase [Gammaproteobacteria bacterium]
MQLGLTPWSLSDTNSAETLCDQAAFAEQLGYEYFFLPEHHFVEGRSIPEPLLMLAAVSARTSKIRLGTTSYLLPIRHPVQAAEQTAVLDQLSNGRLTLGIGRGTAPALFATFGVDPKQKRTLFEDCYNKLIKAWHGSEVADQNSSHPTSISPLPRQKPHPPVWVAAFGPLALKQAGRLGLPYLASPRETLSRLKHNYGIHREACELADASSPEETPIMRSVFVSENVALVRQVRDRIEEFATGMAQGSSNEPNPSIDDWAIIGSPSRVRELLATYRDTLNMTHVIATRLGIAGVPHEDIRGSFAQLVRIREEMSV